jgi:putative ABC transport system substrate-binding protein
MRRRQFLGALGGAAAWPIAARAQQQAMPVVGLLIGATLDSHAGRLAAVRQGLKESGFFEGQNVAIEYRSAEGVSARLPALASELVGRPVSVILALGGTGAAVAAKQATTTIPVVFLTGGDPVELKLVASLNRPGGNVTGLAFLVNKLVAKRLELLNELVPGATTLGMLVDPTNPNAKADATDAQTAAAALGRKLFVTTATTRSDIDAAFAALAAQRVSALFVAAHASLLDSGAQLVNLAARHGIPASYPAREYVEAGGLTTYGPNQIDVHRQVGHYLGRILKGEKPADMPVEQPTKFGFVINLKTAKALGLTISPVLLARADEVIE